MPIVLALPDLAAILILFGALIFIYLAGAIVKALATSASGAVSWIPGVGGFLKVGIHTAEHKIVGVMQTWADGLDASIGWSLHQVAREVDWLGAEIRSHSNLLYTLGAITLGPGFASAIHTAIGLLHIRLSGIAATATYALQRAHTAEKWFTHVLAVDVYPRLRTVEREARHTLKSDIPGLRARAKKIEDELTRAWKAIGANEAALAATAMVGVVALALEKLGGSWIRCSNWNRVGRQVCGVPAGDLEGLLGLFVAGAVIADFRELVKLAQTVEHGVAAGLQEVAKL